MTDKSSQKKTNYICNISLDERTIISKSKEIEHERKAAIFDILDGNTFTVIDDPIHGPFEIVLSLDDNNILKFEINTVNKKNTISKTLDLTSGKKIIKDYFLICESYYAAIKSLTPSQIESIDMARRATHNEGSEWLVKNLERKFTFDFSTARRIFTLICVLHIKST